MHLCLPCPDDSVPVGAEGRRGSMMRASADERELDVTNDVGGSEVYLGSTTAAPPLPHRSQLVRDR